MDFLSLTSLGGNLGYLSVLANDMESKIALANTQETITLIMADSRELEISLTDRNPVTNLYSGAVSGGDWDSLLG